MEIRERSVSSIQALAPVELSLFNRDDMINSAARQHQHDEICSVRVRAESVGQNSAGMLTIAKWWRDSANHELN